MSLANVRHSAASITTTVLIGASLCVAAIPARACDDTRGNAMRTDSTYQHTKGNDADEGTNLEVASQATKATASATASSSASANSSSDGNGNCTAESTASAEATAGDQHQRDYDSASEKSSDGDCRASSESKARATSGSRPPESTGGSGTN